VESETKRITMGSDFMAYLSVPLENFSQLKDRISQYGLDNRVGLLDNWSVKYGKVSFAEMPDYVKRQLGENREQYSIAGIDNKAREAGLTLVDPERSSPYSEAEIWNRVFEGTGVLLMEYYYRLGMPLTKVTITGENGTKTVDVVGFADTWTSEIIIGKSLFSELFPSSSGAKMLFFEMMPEEQENQENAVLELQSDLTLALLSWQPYITSRYIREHSVESVLRVSFDPIENYFLLGVVIGIVGIALVNFRKVQSSRFEYSVLVGLGASKRDLAATATIETTFVIVASIVISIVAPMLFVVPAMETMLSAPVIVPVFKVVFWTLIVLVVTLISSLLPFYQILRLQPTEILREVE
jgi:hypothetical protein